MPDDTIGDDPLAAAKIAPTKWWLRPEIVELKKALDLGLRNHVVTQDEQPTLSPAARFDQAAQDIADKAKGLGPVPRAKMFLSKEDPRLIQRAVCSKCGATIYWLTSKKTGKKMPFDSLVQMVDEAGDLGVDLSKNHWATCPNADDFRKKG